MTSSSNNHLIRSVRFDTAADREATASLFADAMSAIDHQRVFGKVLEQYDGIHEIVRLDQLELDLGAIDINDLDDLEAILARLLDEALAAQLPSSYQQAALLRQVEQTALTAGKQGYEDADTTKQVVYSIAEQIDILVYYFRTGSLPWNVTTQPDIVPMLLDAIKAMPGLLKQRLLPVFTRTEAIQRIVYALPHEARAVLLLLYIDASDLAFIEKIAGVITQELPAHQKITFGQQLAILYFKVVGKDHTAHALFIDAVLMELKPVLQQYAAYIPEAAYHRLSLLPQQEVSTTVYQRFYQQLLVQVEELLLAKGEWTEPTDSRSNKTDTAEKTKMDTDNQPLTEDNTPAEDRTTDAEEEPLQQQALFIDNSGLVLVASFLPVAFRKLGWVEHGKIVDASARDKMLLWMDYLVWGARKTYEYHLSFNKILAGMAPEEVANISFVLTAEERAIADSLLESVIQHWSIIKNTSADGLRGSFLQRPGKMHNEDGGWQLHVQTKPFDMLLDHLPWGMSIVKFSWMEKPVYTQWRTKT